MLPRFAMPLALIAGLSFASPTQAAPIVYALDTCNSGDCVKFDQSGGGHIRALIDVINGNDLLITLSNNLNAYANGDDPFLTSIGFDYSGILSGLTFDSFTVLSGSVQQPTFVIDTSIRSFFIDFGFSFYQNGKGGAPGRFQAADPNEVVQMVIGTTGEVDLSEFGLGIAKVAGDGDGGISNAIVLTGQTVTSVPEPTTLALLALGLVGLGYARRSSTG